MLTFAVWMIYILSRYEFVKTLRKHSEELDVMEFSKNASMEKRGYLQFQGLTSVVFFFAGIIFLFLP